MRRSRTVKLLLLLAIFIIIWLYRIEEKLTFVDKTETQTAVEINFPVGEIIKYKLYWGILPVGEMELWSDWVMLGKKKMLALRGTAKTTSIVKRIYPVDDFIESIVDPNTFLPVRYTQILREGRHERDDITVFNHAKSQAVWRSLSSDEKKEFAINHDTKDILSFCFAMRSSGLGPGEKKSYQVQVEDKIYNLQINAIEIEKVKIKKVGKIDCLKIEPLAQFGEIFVRKGKINLWFSDDERHICTKMKANVFTIASFSARLIEVSGPGSDIWSEDQPATYPMPKRPLSRVLTTKSAQSKQKKK